MPNGHRKPSVINAELNRVCDHPHRGMPLSALAHLSEKKRKALLAELKRREEAAEELRQEKAVIINRVGLWIRKIRDEGGITGRDFVEFRNALYSLPEDDREQAVLDKLEELGIGK